MDGLLKELQRLTDKETGELDSEWFSEFVKQWRQLTEAERKAMVQLEEIRSKLIAKQTELSLLQADINMLAVDRDNKVQEIEGLAIQLSHLKLENETSLDRIQTLEVELEDLRCKNTQLSEELIKKSEQLNCFENTPIKSCDESTEELTNKIKTLEVKIKDLDLDKEKLLKDRELLEKDKESRIHSLQDVLDDALESKIKLQTKYEKQIRDLQESNSSLSDDFEWKLRQIEATCKKKLQDKDRQIGETIKEAVQKSLVDHSTEREALEQERKTLNEQLRQVAHLKAYEAEVVQLRGVTDEQQKSLRASSRQLEQLKFNERTLEEEINNLRTQLEKEKTHGQVLQNSAQRRIDVHEDALKSKLDNMKIELNSKWEEKLNNECTRLKEDLGRLHAEEKRLAIESIKLQKDKDISSAKQVWEKARQELSQEICRLKDEITAKDLACHKEVARATTIIDRDNWELRRKVDKLSTAHMEQLDELKESHTEEMELIQCRYDTALLQLEKLQEKVEQYEKTSRSTESMGTEKQDSGFVPGEASQSQSIVDHTNNDDSECSSAEEEESDEEESEYEDEDEKSEDKTKAPTLVSLSDNVDDKENDIEELREEVATLQDSIETLTLSLVQTETVKDSSNLIDSDTQGPGCWTREASSEEPDTSSRTRSESSALSSETGNESE